MCLGMPGQIVELKSSREAIVDFWGVQKFVRLDNLGEPALEGDFLIDHSGWAVRLIPPADVADTLALYELLLTEAGEDPVAGDVDADLGCGITEFEIVKPALV